LPIAQNISIIGCGWLGRALYNSLVSSYNVRCFTRKESEKELKNYFFRPKKESLFWDCDYLIVAISTKDDYLKALEDISLHVRDKTTVIMMSSISVYREFEREVDEDVLITNSSLQYEAEKLMQNRHRDTLILRLGGLMGEDRVAGRWSKVSKFSDGFVNYVHREDVIKVIKMFITLGEKRGVYNLVAPKHPLRSEVHASNAEKFGFKLGEFTSKSVRKISSKKLIDKFNYSFVYPNPIEFW